MNSSSFSLRIFDPQTHRRTGLVPCIIAVILLFGLIHVTCAAPTTEVRVAKYAADGITVLNETKVSYQWMESNLQVHGDGLTHYYHQGPVFVSDKEGQWDTNETTNFKDMGAVRGTSVRDLCELVGGMNPGDEVMVKASDGYHVEFPYENIYHPLPRQGPIVVCWFNGEETAVGERQGTGYPPSYYVGMRLVFFADNSTNLEGKNVFGNTDMRETMPKESIHLFDNLYPSTSGYTVKWVDEVRIYSDGYHGSSELLPKSYESKMDETYPPPPTRSPFSSCIPLLACLACALMLVKRNDGEP
ncbi:MAG: argininosuccinate synthase [Methanoregulaceae archaeon]